MCGIEQMTGTYALLSSLQQPFDSASQTPELDLHALASSFSLVSSEFIQRSCWQRGLGDMSPPPLPKTIRTGRLPRLCLRAGKN